MDKRGLSTCWTIAALFIMETCFAQAPDPVVGKLTNFPTRLFSENEWQLN